MMNDWNVRRKARGRIRRARRRRRRQRMSAIGVFILLCLSIFAFGAVDYGAQRHTGREIAKHPRVSFSLPPPTPLIARAKSSRPDYGLPDFLNIEGQYPGYRRHPIRRNSDEPSSANEREEPVGDPSQQMVILDDLRAAPPKSMFIKAVFDSPKEEPRLPASPIWIPGIFSETSADLFGQSPDNNQPKNLLPVPEPGTGVLLGLGLTLLANRRWRFSKKFGVVRSSWPITPEG